VPQLFLFIFASKSICSQPLSKQNNSSKIVLAGNALTYVGLCRLPLPVSVHNGVVLEQASVRLSWLSHYTFKRKTFQPSFPFLIRSAGNAKKVTLIRLFLPSPNVHFIWGGACPELRRGVPVGRVGLEIIGSSFVFFE
jgi:hypothetical protein